MAATGLGGGFLCGPRIHFKNIDILECGDCGLLRKKFADGQSMGN